MSTPKIYPWSREEILSLFTDKFAETFPGMVDTSDPQEPKILDDLTNALVNVTSRMVETTINRTNKVGDKGLLTMLSQADQSLILPNPAQCTVKFSLAEGSEVNPRLPTGTQVSTQSSDFREPIIFETQDPLTVINPDLEKLVTVDFDQSKFEDKSQLLETILDIPEKLYQTNDEFTYKLHLSHPLLEELGQGRVYYLQVILNFETARINKALSESEIDGRTLVPRSFQAFDVDKESEGDTIFDFNLFRVSVKIFTGEDKVKTTIIKDIDMGVNNISHVFNEGDVFFIPIKIDQPITPKTLSGFSPSKGVNVQRTLPFVTVELQIRNREYFNLFEPPKLIDAKFKLFFLPHISAVQGDLQLEKDSFGELIPTLSPLFDDQINIENAFFNDQEIDISKPFFPFGEKPQVNDTFYFSSIFFSRGGEECEIDLWILGDLDRLGEAGELPPFKAEQNSGQKPQSNNIMLGWEYFDGQEWIIFAKSLEKDGEFKVESDEDFIDASEAFTKSAHFTFFNPSQNPDPTILFTIPKNIQKATVNDFEDWWLRVRILKGNYGNEIQLDASSDKGFQDADFTPPIFRTFTVSFSRGNRNNFFLYEGFPALPAQEILTENDFSLVVRKENNAFASEDLESFPIMDLNRDFGITHENSDRVLYIGITGEDIPGKQEALFFTIIPESSTLIQDQELEEQEDGNPEPLLERKLVDFNFRNVVPKLKWEYWSSHPARTDVATEGGSDLDPSLAFDAWRDLEVNDRTNNLTSEQAVEFIMPQDANRRVLFGEELFWVRVIVPKRCRIKNFRSDDLSFFREEVVTFNDQIRIRGLNQNMVVAESIETVKGEVLGASTGRPNQTFTTSSSPVALGPKIQVREVDLPSADESLAIISLEGEDAILEQINEDGEKEVLVRWHQVPDFNNSGPMDRHYVMDHSNGQIRFGDGVQGRIPDEGARSIVAEEYRFGRGAGGNVDVGDIRTMVSAVPYVDRVVNVGTARGGAAIESLPQVSERGLRSIRHGERAVTLEDFETLALEAAAGVLQARAFTARRPDGIYERGWVTVAIVVSQLGGRPAPNGDIISRVKNHLVDRAEASMVNGNPKFVPPGFIIPPERPDSDCLDTELTPEGADPSNSDATSGFHDRMNVVPPNYLKIGVEAEIVFVTPEAAFDGVPTVRNKLAGFLHAITGGPESSGWDFGRDVYQGEVYKVIHDVPQVKTVHNAVIKANQMRFTIPIEPVQFDLNFRGEQQVIARDTAVTVTYAKYGPDPSDPFGGDPMNRVDFTFSFLTGLGIKSVSEEIVVHGFKEGDIINVKMDLNVSHRTFFWRCRH